MIRMLMFFVAFRTDAKPIDWAAINAAIEAAGERAARETDAYFADEERALTDTSEIEKLFPKAKKSTMEHVK